MLKKKIKFFKPNLILSKKLAIIGSSASILKKKNGNKIDQYDEIIRFNNSKIENYEEYVGSKTTTRVVNNPTFECAPMWDYVDEDRYFVKNLRNINIAVISPYKIDSRFKEENCSDKNNYFFLENKYFQYLTIFYFFKNLSIIFNMIKIFFGKKNFSIGFYTIVLSIISGIKPTLFGFDLNEDMNNRSHYWEKPGKVGNRHNLSLEHKIIYQFINEGFINLVD